MVPATAQQVRPPFLPPLTSLIRVSVAAGQTPGSAAFAPPGSLPHIFTSQQFFFFIEFSYRTLPPGIECSKKNEAKGN
jgi:hypothetical protein